MGWVVLVENAPSPHQRSCANVKCINEHMYACVRACTHYEAKQKISMGNFCFLLCSTYAESGPLNFPLCIEHSCGCMSCLFHT
ncbi:hypothetical protein POVWA2_017410 [Plasmodium ovale wallikeri]|uniref:Uncharacterized protein n=1 Tax=Plasmodium ovale wallikeri TaxID=864142 RepID=A0A1A8YQQ1_PLAOA|nr:hypothetical protein POVWA1_017520 [Plasmodium ovale wallikeri]SBT33945.1 hypothetical protein POVWA2_017410 [Plasmodium ovale wallikeri]